MLLYKQELIEGQTVSFQNFKEINIKHPVTGRTTITLKPEITTLYPDGNIVSKEKPTTEEIFADPAEQFELFDSVTGESQGMKSYKEAFDMVLSMCIHIDQKNEQN